MEQTAVAPPKLTYWHQGQVCCAGPWEKAYARFETPEEEIRKFMQRLRALGAHAWPRENRIVEIFCGRGNGLVALQRLGFTNLEGIDLSASLLEQYRGPAKLIVADCRTLRYEDNSIDAMIVQGGLHHLDSLPDDVDKTLAEARRVLKPGGRMALVEPWLTPFLRFVHAVSENTIMRRMWDKLDAFAEMRRYEQRTYEQWLAQPEMLKSLLSKHFQPELQRTAWGKIMFVGRKRT